MNCAECGKADAIEVSPHDSEVLGDEFKAGGGAVLHGGLAGGLLVTVGFHIAKAVVAKYMDGMAFCIDCRDKVELKDPFAAITNCSAAAFFLTLFLITAPISWILYIVSIVLLRKRLREFWKAPRAAYLEHALQAIGTLTISLFLHLIFVGVMIWVFRSVK